MIGNMAFVLKRGSLSALLLTVVHFKVSYLTLISLTVLNYKMGDNINYFISYCEDEVRRSKKSP